MRLVKNLTMLNCFETCNSIKVIQFQTCHVSMETLTLVSHVAGINVTVALVLTVHINPLPRAFLLTTQHQLSQSKTDQLRIQNTLSYFTSGVVVSI